jgi:hypothetical protein
VEARKAAQDRGATVPAATPTAPARAERVVSLTQRRLAEATTLPADSRPLPSVEAYDELLTRRPPAVDGGRRHPVSPGRRGVTEQAADAGIEQACRLLRLPTIRAGSERSPTQPSGST